MAANRQNFATGLSLIFSRWAALSLAKQCDWGGVDTAEKAVWFESTLVTYFGTDGNKLEAEDIEEILLDIMRDEFNVELEDDSAWQIANQLMELYRDCLKGQTFILEKIKAKPTVPLLQIQQQQPLSSSEGEGEEEEEEEEDMSSNDDFSNDKEEMGDDNQMCE